MREGTRFEQFYVTGVTCCPSRTGFMTGKFPATFAKYPADFGFGDRATVTQLLKERGYATGHFGKWHIGPKREGGTYGLDAIEELKAPRQRRDADGRDAKIYDAAIEFIAKNKDRPFYVNVWGHITHFPVNPPKQFAERFKNVEVKESDFGGPMRDKFAQVRKMGYGVDAAMRNYLGAVSSLDDDVGRLLAKLDELGLEDNTLVVFSSDHGPAPILPPGKNKRRNALAEQAERRTNMLGSPGPFRGGKHTMLEGGVRVPFIIRWPHHVPAGRVDRDSVLSGIDWLPTLCSLAGIKIDADDFDGEDVSSAWLGRAVPARSKPLFWRVSHPGAPVGIRDGRWKLYVPRRRQDETELYDVTADPAEEHNLATKNPDVVKTLSARIEAWKRALPEEYTKSNSQID